MISPSLIHVTLEAGDPEDVQFSVKVEPTLSSSDVISTGTVIQTYSFT